MNKTLKRLQDRMATRVLGQILYIMQQASSVELRQRIAVALSLLTTADSPAAPALSLIFVEKKGLDVLLEMLTDPEASTESQRQAARAAFRLAESVGATAPIMVEPVPPEPTVSAAWGLGGSGVVAEVRAGVERGMTQEHGRSAVLAVATC